MRISSEKQHNPKVKTMDLTMKNRPNQDDFELVKEPRETVAYLSRRGIKISFEIRNTRYAILFIASPWTLKIERLGKDIFTPTLAKVK